MTHTHRRSPGFVLMSAGSPRSDCLTQIFHSLFLREARVPLSICLNGTTTSTQQQLAGSVNTGCVQLTACPQTARTFAQKSDRNK
ncbi:hypothetical protein BaRGS_00036143, partial [Batillaria attramentaria]